LAASLGERRVSVPIKYRAFLSYNHQDSRIAMRVHARLESFRIDKDFVGRATPAGPVPQTLRPIFRDRNDFDAGGTLGEETVAALDASAALIVIASPQAAKSKYVNEEIRLFKWRHPERAIVPLIVDGEPGDPENECFPPALRFAVGADGVVTGEPTDVLAADLREKGDGFALALAKVVARLIGLAPDTIYRRAERERRRQERLRIGIAAVIALLVIVGGVFFWRSRQQAVTLAEIDALVAKYSVVDSAQAAVPGARESLTQAITAIAEGAARDPRYAEALELLKAGKAAEAEPLLKAVAEDKAKRADKDAKDAAAAYRNLASIAAVSDHKRAREDYAEAARLDPSNIEGLIWDAQFQAEAGQLNAAEAAYNQVVALAKPGVDDHILYWARLGLGNIEKERGDLAAALTTYRAAQTIVENRAKSDPRIGWRRDLSVAYEKIGNVLVAEGNLPEALTSYQAGLAIAESLAQSKPGDAGAQRDLLVSYNEVGDVLVAEGNLPGALKSYQAGLAIAERLAKSDPSNAGAKRDLSVSYGKIGDVLVGQGDLAGALRSYQAGVAIAENLAKSDPDNAGWQRDLSVSYDEIGNVLTAQGDFAGAVKSYQAGLAIAENLAKSDPGNAGWQRDLSVSYNKVGDVARHGNLPKALKSYLAGLAITERLAKSDPDNAGAELDLSVSYDEVGDVLVAEGNLPDALKSYQASLNIREGLTKADPGDAGWRRDLSVSYNKVGDILMAEGNLPEALNSYQAGFAIIDPLSKSDPGNAGWQSDLAVSNAKLAYAYLKGGEPLKARESFDLGRTIIARLVARYPSWSLWQQELAWFDRQMAVFGK
jgi:tetratricopeptide (TPR) repeat protein